MAERIRLLVQDEKALEYLVHRVEEGEKQRLLRHVLDKADAALRAGKREIDALSAAIEQNRAIPSLLSAIWNSTAEQHRRNGGAQRSVKLRELVTEYTATVDRMADFVRSLEEIVPRELLPADGKTPELGAELGSSEIVLNPVPLSAVERFWMKIGIASVPVLRRILLEPGWKKRLARLERDLKQGAQHRIRLLGEEYVRVVTNITEHVKSAVLHAPKSNHGAALAKLSEELEQALRLAREERSQAGVTTRNMSAERSVAHATCCICQHVANVQFHSSGSTNTNWLPTLTSARVMPSGAGSVHFTPGCMKGSAHLRAFAWDMHSFHCTSLSKSVRGSNRVGTLPPTASENSHKSWLESYASASYVT